MKEMGGGGRERGREGGGERERERERGRGRGREREEKRGGGGRREGESLPCMSLSPRGAPHHWRPSTHEICTFPVFSLTLQSLLGSYNNDPKLHHTHSQKKCNALGQG